MTGRILAALAGLALAACATTTATSRPPATAGVTGVRTYVCYDKQKNLIYGNPREVAARGCLGDDARVTVEEAAQLKKEHWLAQPATQILLDERACRDTLADKVYALPRKLMSGIDLKCVTGDEEISDERARQMVREQQRRETRSASTERAARENLEIIRRLNQALTERRFTDVERMVAELQSTGEMVTALNWLGQKIDDGAGAAYVRAYVALAYRLVANASKPDEMKDLAARMTAYLYLVATIDVARCSVAKEGVTSLVTVIQEAKPSFEHLASISRERRDAAIAFAIAKEQSLAQRRGNDPWVCRYDAATTPAGSEVYADEITARQRQAAFRLIFPASLRQLVELMVHDSSRL